MNKQLIFNTLKHIALWIIYLLLPLIIVPRPDVNYIERSHFLLYNYFFSSLYSILFFYVNFFWAIPRFAYKNKKWKYVLVLLFFVMMCFVVYKILPTVINFETERILFFQLFAALLKLVFVSIVAWVIFLYKRDKEHTITKNQAELAYLKAQINPHFLFNSLSTLQTLVRKDASESEDFVHNLSDIYRQLLHSRESNVSTLEEELVFLNTYMDLLKTRHGTALQVDIVVDESVKKLQLPSFALQLLVENCTKHNIISRDSPLQIRIIQAANKISVSNNLQLKKSVDSVGVGLENLRKRYALMKISEGVVVSSSDAEFKVDIKLF